MNQEPQQFLFREKKRRSGHADERRPLLGQLAKGDAQATTALARLNTLFLRPPSRLATTDRSAVTVAAHRRYNPVTCAHFSCQLWQIRPLRPSSGVPYPPLRARALGSARSAWSPQRRKALTTYGPPAIRSEVFSLLALGCLVKLSLC